MNTRLLFAVALVHVICEFLPSYPDPQEPSRIRWTRSCARIAGFSVCLWAFALDASVWPLFLAAVIAQTILDDCVDPNSGLRGLLCDQLLHAATLLVLLGIAETPLALELVPALRESTSVWIGIAGFAITVFVGGVVVGRLVRPFAAALELLLKGDQPGGLENAGRLIGILERALIFTSVLLEFGDLIGFVVAAKAILRFPETRAGSRELSEYYLVGTLASVTWAVTAAVITRAALH